MRGHWTFGQKIGAGFAVTIVLAILSGIVAVYALRNTISSKDRVIATDVPQLLAVYELEILVERKSTESRGFLLVRDERFLTGIRNTRAQFHQIDGIVRAEEEHQRVLEQGIALRRTDNPIDAVIKTFDEQVVPARDQLDTSLRAFVAFEREVLRTATQASTEAANTAMVVVIGITIALVVAAIGIAFVLTRSLGRNQQATSSREQSTAMSEISTTISELLATSRQITESAQRVAQIAADTARAANAGETTVEQTQESIAGIRRQVDLIVNHMLELGRKSQHIGAVLDIVSELAEQTNILAINATIEAAGAGDAGRRFAVVADEIRKLADRVTGSTKEIRSLIDDVRSAVNTTVMATETGSKTVDAGTKQFDHVAASFKQIVGQVGTTTEAAREIELSTKQQMSAVEQVNIAIANIAQASKETEASSSQTLQTASQLATLSKDLLRLVKPEIAA
jgi:methyl-accepting chemotaxis protein